MPMFRTTIDTRVVKDKIFRIRIFSFAVCGAIGVTFCSAFALSQSKDTIKDMTPAIVHYCSDGDTCRIALEQEKIWFNVRLFGIDAPETEKKHNKQKSQPLGSDAKDYINSRIKDKIVTIVQADLDPYNRPVVEIFHEGKSINIELIENGLAEVYRGKTKRIDKKRFEDAESKAKIEKKGIWSLKDYVSPKDFRSEQKRQN